MAELAGFNRPTSSDEIPINNAQAHLPERIAPGRSTGVAVMGSEVPVPQYPQPYPTGPSGSGNEGDVR